MFCILMFITSHLHFHVVKIVSSDRMHSRSTPVHSPTMNIWHYKNKIKHIKQNFTKYNSYNSTMTKLSCVHMKSIQSKLQKSKMKKITVLSSSIPQWQLFFIQTAVRYDHIFNCTSLIMQQWKSLRNMLL